MVWSRLAFRPPLLFLIWLRLFWSILVIKVCFLPDPAPLPSTGLAANQRWLALGSGLFFAGAASAMTRGGMLSGFLPALWAAAAALSHVGGGGAGFTWRRTAVLLGTAAAPIIGENSGSGSEDMYVRWHSSTFADGGGLFDPDF